MQNFCKNKHHHKPVKTIIRQTLESRQAFPSLIWDNCGLNIHDVKKCGCISPTPVGEACTNFGVGARTGSFV